MPVKGLVNHALRAVGYMLVKRETVDRLQRELERSEKARDAAIDVAEQWARVIQQWMGSTALPEVGAPELQALQGVQPPDTVHGHSVFSLFRPWEGYVPPEFDVTCYGSLIRRQFLGIPPREAGYSQGPAWPSVSDEYFEWIDVLEAIAAARGRFTMLELGAGFGRWAVAAATVIRRHRNMPFILVAAEAEGSHYEMLQRHFLDNGLHPEDHWLIRAAITAEAGEVYFTEGHATEWYGQSVLDKPDREFGDWKEARVVRVPGMPLRTILERLDYVDLIHMDIQGQEALVCAAAAQEMTKKVKRVHIGTHSRDIEHELQRIFDGMAWKSYQNYRCNSTTLTPYGIVTFQDGIQTWINPHLDNPNGAEAAARAAAHARP
jgi:FkbM family methyltransferase